MLLKWLSYPRSILGVILLVLHTVLCASLFILLNILFNNRKIEDQVVVFWTRGCCLFFNVKVSVSGLENRPEGGFLYVFNHTSFFDIFAMNGWLGSFRFGAKIELFDIPIFGAGMRRAGILPIARSQREEVFRVYKNAEIRLKNGERFALAPEGTRQEIEKLGRFKSGPFVFAINSQVPIVPVIIKGAAAIMPKGHWLPNWGVWKSEIQLQVLLPIETKGYDLESRPQLQEKVHQIMEPYFA